MGLYFFRRRSLSFLSVDLANFEVWVDGDDPGLTASGLRLSAFLMGVVERVGMSSITFVEYVNVILVGLFEKKRNNNLQIEETKKLN